MKKTIRIVFITVALLVSCNYEDDHLNKNPEPEVIETHAATVTVINNAESPLEGAAVKLWDASETEIGTLTTESNGTVTFAEVEAGTYTVEASYEEVNNTETLTLTNQDAEITVPLDVDPENVLHQNSPFVITGLCSDPRGSDGAADGTSSAYEGGTIVVDHVGGYEYVQFMALENIDFAQTPYSIVVCSNGTAGPNGWAQGGSKTLKFDLTSGTAEKGAFFYVGGMSKVISGYGSCGKSTDISSSNWIRTIDYKTDGGDGLGDPRGGLFGNMGSSGSNTADGVAVFEGTEIAESSVPLDAVFYGTDVNGAYDEENGWGYRVPLQNDHYTVQNPETGADQPYFGQGTNTYLFSQPAQDIGEFSKLGGSTGRDQWARVRSTTIVQLSYCPGESSLDDIENAEGVTVFTD